MGIKKIMLTIDEEVVKVIDKMAKDDGRSRNNYITRIITDHLQSENKEKQLQDRMIELEKELLILKTVPNQTMQPTKKEIIEDDDLLEPIQYPKFKGGS